ncbi:MAG: hypothetical protein ACRC62_15840 [Microcoleus sp.]
MTKGKIKVGGATPRNYKLSNSAIAILPIVGGGNATEGIERLTLAYPWLLEAHAELAGGTKRQRAIADRIAIALCLELDSD